MPAEIIEKWFRRQSGGDWVAVTRHWINSAGLGVDPLRVEKCPYHWVIDARNVSKFIMRWRYSMVDQVDCVRLHRDRGGNWGGIGNDVGDDINIIRM